MEKTIGKLKTPLSLLPLFLTGIVLTFVCMECPTKPQVVDSCAISKTECEGKQAGYAPDHYLISFEKPWLDSVCRTWPESKEKPLFDYVIESFGDSLLGPNEMIVGSCGCGVILVGPDGQTTVDIEDRTKDAKSRLTQNGGKAKASLDFEIKIGPVLDTTGVHPFVLTSDTIPTYVPQANSGLKPVRVAIIDTGSDYGHYGLSSLMWENTGEINSSAGDDDYNCHVDDIIGYDFINDQPEFADQDGHGTHVAGIVAKRVGLDTDVQLDVINIKIMNRGQTSLSSAICGIHYAISAQAQIMNLSWGYYAKEKSDALESVLKEAERNGIIVVTSAGNDNLNVDCCAHWPSDFTRNLDNVLSIAALDNVQLSSPLKIADYSNFGKLSVDFAATGTDINSYFPDNGMAILSGTSMAAPTVTGDLAKIIANNPSTPFGSVIGNLTNNHTTPLNTINKPTHLNTHLNY